jgi:hypothetical protein
MYSKKDVTEKIRNGEKLFLSGDEKVLRDLPTGTWIAGTIPYFMGDDGGVFSQDQIYVTQLPDYLSDVKIKVYDENTLSKVYEDIPDNGVGLIIIPASSSAHLTFALKSPTYPGFGTKPLIGWIAGVFLDELGKNTPKVVNGEEGKLLESEAVVMHLSLPANKQADISITNIFDQGTGDSITFGEDGFSAKEVKINGKTVNFAEYVTDNKLDTRLPLVADYYGAKVNISFQSVDEDNKEVHFYAPVFAGMEYKHAKPVSDYVSAFTSQMPNGSSDKILFSCNCILNYLYSELEGKKTGDVTGPMTFGEVAYQLLNQTLVYLNIEDA